MQMKFLEIWTEELSAPWRWDPEKYVGGTTEFYIETAKAISEDTEVIIYYDGPAKYIDRVYYLPRGRFIGKDIVLSCNSHAPKKGKHNIYWTSWFKQKEENCLEYDERIVLSPYHQTVFGQNSRIVPLSCWSERFKGVTKVPRQCLYSSSPDRGLDFLNSIWKEVHNETGAILISTYNKMISEEQMEEFYKDSQFWLHPGRGIELFCISAVKAQVAGCIPVIVPTMALETTVKYGVKTTPEKYKEDLIKAIKNPPSIEPVNFGSWETVTNELFKNTGVLAEAK